MVEKGKGVIYDRTSAKAKGKFYKIIVRPDML